MKGKQVIGFKILLLTMLALMVACQSGTAEPETDGRMVEQQAWAEAGGQWLIDAHQNEDGGYASFSAGAELASSDVGGTLDAVIALAAAGADTSAPAAWLQANADDVMAYAGTNGGQAGKALLGINAIDGDVQDFGGNDLIIQITSLLTVDGAYSVETAFEQSLAMLGFDAAGEEVPPVAVRWLKSLQAEDGSWDDGFGTLGNADATAMAVMALVAAGEPVSSDSLVNAKSFLANTQLPTGGFEYGAGFGENANSTALVVQALGALGEDFYTTDGAWSKEGNTPMSALHAYQGESGAFQADFGSGMMDDFFTTVQALPALTK